MKTSSFYSQLDLWLAPYWKTATPGLSLEVYQAGEKVIAYQGGEFYPYYDLASLTKVLFTVPAMMIAHHKKWWQAETRVSDVLSWWPHPQTKVVDLLCHNSGLLWWKAFYKDLEKQSSLSKRWQLLQEDLKIAPIEAPTKSVYSDLGFLTLSFLLQKLWSQSQSFPISQAQSSPSLQSQNLPSSHSQNSTMFQLQTQLQPQSESNPLSSLWEQVKSEFAPESTLHWIGTGEKENSHYKIPSHTLFPHTYYAPTELCPWRGRRLQGEVHDENAWILGGLSTHAGLFGNPSDVSSVFLKFRAIHQNPSHPMHFTMQTFMQRQTPKEKGDWALGLMMPTPGVSSSGQYFSEKSLGHTGFTGTSVWWDPEADLLIVLLSNRVYYGREQREFAKLRPLLHDRIVEHLLRL